MHVLGAAGSDCAGTETSRYLVSIREPEHAYFYRHIITELQRQGHTVRVYVRDDGTTSSLLDGFGIGHTVLAQDPGSLPEALFARARYEAGLLREARRFRPDVLTSVGGVDIAHVAPAVGARTLAFVEHRSTGTELLRVPAPDVVCTPEAFPGAVSGEQRQYDGCQQLAYLHPDRFEARPERLRQYGIDPEERLFLLRFTDSSLGRSDGLSQDAQQELVSTLSNHGDVYIRSAEPLPTPLSEHRVPVPPLLLHDLLSAANLYVGDSKTMATEAAVLGTPAIRYGQSTPEAGVLAELESDFGLVASFGTENRTIRAVRRWLAEPDLQSTWRARRGQLLNETEDVTAFAVEQLDSLGIHPDDSHPPEQTPAQEPAMLRES